MAINVDIAAITGINQVGNSYQRKSAVPLDYYSLFNTKAEAEAYAASNPVSYVGQVISYIDNNEVKVCVIANAAGLLKEVGTAPVGAENGAINVTDAGAVSVNVDGKSIEIANNKIAMHDFGTAYYEYVPEEKDEETGEVTKEASYARVEVSESKPWKAGLEPKVVTEGGQLVIGWFEPNPTTIEGVNDQVTAVQGTVADLETSVGMPSAEGQEATGLYKEVEDVQGEVEELANSVGSAEDSLGEDVDTLWAHVNDHEERIVALEENVETTNTAIGTAKDRADAAYALAEKKVDAESYATDKKALQDEDAAIRAIAEGVRDAFDVFMQSEEIDETVNTLKELQAEIEKMTDATELATALAAKADADSVYTKDEADDLLAGKQDVIPENTYDAYGAAASAQSAAEAKAAELATAAKEAAIGDADGKLALKADASAVYTKEEANNLLNAKANAADVYAKSETYTQAQVDELLEGIQAGSSESAASVNTKLEALKKTLNNEIYGNDDGTGDSRIDTAEAKLAGIAEGAQVNVIESVAGVEGNRIAISTTGKAVSIDDSGLRADIADAKAAGTNAGNVASQAVQAAGENANKIQTNTGDITNLKTLTGEHTEKISAIESVNATHDAEFKALKGTVDGHTTAIAGKAEQSSLDAVSAKAGANEQAIKTLNETTIPGINAEVAKKANADNVYTKAEIGTIASDKTIVQMITDAQAAATYNDAEVRGLISDNATAIENITKEGGAIDVAVAEEAAIARAAEKKNADDIAAINAVLNTVDSEDTITSLKELAIWVEEHGGEASKMAEAIEANTEAIAAINDATNGVLVQAKAHSDANLATAKAYTDAELAKVHGIDDKTIKLAENKAYVAEVSTDILVQGTQELVLCAGDADV